MRIGGVGQPTRVGGPAVGDAIDRPVNLGRRYRLRCGLLYIEHEQRLRVVDVGDLLAVGRPAKVRVEAGPFESVGAGFAFSILRFDVQRVSARCVRDVSDPSTVGRPRGCAFVGAWRVRQVPGITLLRRHGEDLTAELEYGSGATGRN